MQFLNVLAVILTLSGVFSYINERYLKFPLAVGMMILGLGLSITIQISSLAFPEVSEYAQDFIRDINFSDLLLEFMLSYLLFAGALHTDWNKLKLEKIPIITFATIGVVLSTSIIACALYYLTIFTGHHIPFIHCLLFGALISPTDPIAVLGILRQAKIPESLEIKIVGESLFNDGFGIVLFLTVLGVAREGVESISVGEITFLLAEEIIGGILLGVVLGYVVSRMLRDFSHAQSEALLTLAVVTGGYAIASLLHFSGPLAMVAAGLFIGNKQRSRADKQSSEFTFKFWEIVDEILNALLFVVIGLEVLLIRLDAKYIVLGFFAIVITILARYISLFIPSHIGGFRKRFKPNAIQIMTWGGLRGGISVAIALSLPQSASREVILTLTYTVVVFSIMVQGLTLGPLIKRLRVADTD